MKHLAIRLKLPDDLAKLIRNMHPALKKKVRAGLEAIIEQPAAGKSLRDELKGLASYRIGTFRIIYRKTERHIIEIVAIGPRKNIYQETFRIISREN